MFSGNQKRAASARSVDIERMFAAISRSQAVIEFDLDGVITNANQNFCDFTGYSLPEVQGKHHSMFLDPAEASSPEYREFWRRLNAGEFIATKFRRFVRGGREVWIQASYNPVLDETGKAVKVMKVATDITANEMQHLRNDAERKQAEALQAELVSALAEGLGRLSDGDLTARIDNNFEGAYRAIRDNFNGAVDSLKATLGRIDGAIGPLRSGADEIASATSNLSRRTEQQASSLEETVAALDQLTATVKRSAEGAKEASAVASQAKDEALRSGEVVREAVDAMGEIEQSSGKITQIIGVIDEIAFQTNLLALNAGVEAARAGDAGRGFAVVAQEVRELAQRSASAAREIKGLIASSTVHVERGVSLVGATGEALSGLVTRAAQIDTLISEIAVSAREQSTGLHEVNSAMNQMDQVTQQNASMVEETTAAVTQLNDQTVELATLIGQFDIGAAKKRGSARIADNPVRQLRRRIGAAAAANWQEF